MQVVDDDKTILSPSDLVAFAGCRHLTELDRAAAGKKVKKPHYPDPGFELLLKRGLEHEAERLAHLKANAAAKTKPGGPRQVTEFKTPDSFAEAQEVAKLTEEAMRRGDYVIYQAAFVQERDGHTWRGYADFLVRVETKSDLGKWSYEPADAKLARAAKAGAVLQLCAYAEMVAHIQGRLPDEMSLFLGGAGHPVERLRLSDYFAYYRYTKAEFLAALARPSTYPELPTYPEPVERCGICDWSQMCEKQRRADDHLSLVAGITRNQIAALEPMGITTVSKLAVLPIPLKKDPPRTSAAAVERAREQARLQVESRGLTPPKYDLLPLAEPDLGLGALPEPSPGDLFFDIEGDRFWGDAGIEYLFGLVEPGKPDKAGKPTEYAFWAQDAASEKKAFEQVIDLITTARKLNPNLHVFHYNHYEPTQMRRLMCLYATREAEVDDLLRSGVFVDLYRVVRQGIRAGVESYSIKDLEVFYGFVRKEELRQAGAARADLETWLELGAKGEFDPAVREQVRVYNLEDCLSAWELRDWLEGCRTQLGKQMKQAIPRPPPRVVEDLTEMLEKDADVTKVANALRDIGDPATALLGNLLDYHRREGKSGWWEFHNLCTLSDEELIDNTTTIGGLTYVGPGEQVVQSILHAYRFPPQEYGIKEGTKVADPRTKEAVGEVWDIDDAKGLVYFKRGKNAGPPPKPTALVPKHFVGTDVLRDSLVNVGTWVTEHGIDAKGSHRAARDLLLRRPPRLKPKAEGTLVAPGKAAQDEAIRLVGMLHHGVLAVQGPPGSGKTHGGAEMALALIEMGHRVGLTANSHKVIANFIEKLCELAKEKRRTLHIVQRGAKDEVVQHDWVKPASDNAAALAAATNPKVQVIAGTAWLWARADMAGSVKTLFIDEASQFSLANGVAVAHAAESLVLLGDPQQLEQPIKGVHPPGAEVSVLGHILGGAKTIAPEQGIFLDRTRRLHPKLCAFTSELFYEGKLSSMPGLEKQRLLCRAPLDGTGLRVVSVDHVGNQNESEEEVAEVVRIFDLLRKAGSWTDNKGKKGSLGVEDILVIAPYNAHVGALKKALPENARVGTVDKFQGQEAPVVIYSMATSSPAEAPRGMPFLYSPNRLNVATSRAKCLAVVVASPELFRVACQTPEQMKLANAFCRLREVG